MLAPIVIFVYNRPEHIRKTVEALSKNILAKESEVYIYSDAAKTGCSMAKVNEVRDYIDSLKEKKYFKSVVVEKAKSNRGLAASVILGVNQVIEKYGKVIVVEDDLISSQDFLMYMNEALDYYENNNKVWSISGYNIPIKIPKDYKSEIYFSYRGCSWGWATWKDMWEKVDWEVSDYAEFKGNKRLRRRLNRGGRDMANMLDSQIKGKIDSWAIRWCYTQSKLDMLTVYPVVSRIENIGLDGTGTHGGVSAHYEASLNEGDRKCTFENIKLDERILKNFKEHYMSILKYPIFQLKIIVKNILQT